MLVHIWCEYSATTREAFTRKGHDAWSVDLLLGHGERKPTCLWLKGLPKLKPTNIVEGREQRIWRMAPSLTRGLERARTFRGIAEAMAEQWG